MKKVPYIISGAGGYANIYKLLHKIEVDKNGEKLQDFQTAHEDLIFKKYNDQEQDSFALLDKKRLISEYFLVPFDSGSLEKRPFDLVKVFW